MNDGYNFLNYRTGSALWTSPADSCYVRVEANKEGWTIAISAPGPMTNDHIVSALNFARTKLVESPSKESEQTPR